MKNSYRDLVLVAVAVLAVKIIVFIFGVLVFDFVKYPFNTVLSIWNYWDVTHYLRIAEHGYGQAYPGDDNRFLIYFPPLFPFFIYALHFISGLSFAVSAFIVSNFFSLLASFVLFLLVNFETGSKRMSHYAVLFLNLFPTAYFLLVPYSESVFLFFVILTFYNLRVRKNFYGASIAAAAAVLSRSVGFLLIPVLFIWLLANRNREENYFKSIFQLSFISLPVVAFLSQNFVGYFHHNDFMFIFNYRPNYTIQFGTYPFHDMLQAFQSVWNSPALLRDQEFLMTSFWSAVFLFTSSLILLFSCRRINWIYLFFSISYLGFLSSCSHLIALPRYVLCCFPLYLVFVQIKNRFLLHATLIGSFALLLYFTKIYVRGSWAF